MKVIFRIERALLDAIHADLNRLHPFAAERVGFIVCRIAYLTDGQLLLAQSYKQIADEDYENNSHVGAMMNANAIRKALQFAYNNSVAMFHVHRHEHVGRPKFSSIDVREYGKFVPDFRKVQPTLSHGAILFSYDSMIGAWWCPKSKQPHYIDEMAVIGRPVVTFGGVK